VHISVCVDASLLANADRTHSQVENGECSGFHNISIDVRGPSSSLAQWVTKLLKLDENKKGK